MRRLALLFTLALAMPLAAQNSDIESMSGLQFNFGNPGARSLGMGGAFLGLADDASAAEANPAGLTILRKPEISLEARNYLEQQVLTTSGTYPDLERTAFTHHSDRVVVSFASAVYPFKNNFTLGFYFHEPLRNKGSGQVVPDRNEFTGAIRTDVPGFFLPRDGNAPVSQEQCAELTVTDPFACVGYTVNPFLTAVDVQQRTFGLAGAWKFKKLSVGGAVRMQTFRESAFTYRVTPTFDFNSIAVQATADVVDGEPVIKDEKDVTFSLGLKYEFNDKISVGGVYKLGPEFVAPTLIANADTDFEFVKLADTTFHVPDVAGVGVSVRPIPILTINFDAVRVSYSNLVDDFVATNANVREAEGAFEAKDVIELHLGAEYFFANLKIPLALRAGYWRDPAHSIEWRGTLDQPDFVAEAILFPKGEDQNHFSIGAGLAWPRFQIDAAYDTGDRFKVGSISMVTRF